LDGINNRPGIIAEAIRQHQNGSIITLTWHAVCSLDDEPNEWKKSVWHKMTEAEWTELVTPGTPLNRHWQAQVDVIAGFLKQLQEARVPVLWRPYHEMNGDWFWWCGKKGEKGFRALWRLMFDRFVNYHRLNNLLWVWSPNAPGGIVGPYADYFPGQDCVDVLAVDVYIGFKQPFYDDLVALAAGKPVALGEVGKLPTPVELQAQPGWVWFMEWNNMLTSKNTPEEILALYSDRRTLTRDRVQLAMTNTEAGGRTGLDAQMNPAALCTNLSMHPFLYAGEFQKQDNDYFDNQKVYLVRDGKVVWTYNVTKASVGGRLVELGDISMKSNGHIVMSLGWGGAREIIPDYTNPANSRIVWSCQADEQIHTAQPVGDDKIFVIDNSKKPKAKLFDQTTGAVRVWDLPAGGTDAHGMFRHCRLTASGTLLIAHMNMAKVVEYDSETLKPIWTCTNLPNAWAAVRLKNGNTLVSGNENKWVREVNPQGQVVWEFSNRDLPAGSGINLGNVQECDRLANGNTVICTWRGSPSVLEVTPDKRIVWTLPKDYLGNSSSIQLLDEPGAMEHGDLQR
jgi:mannan endo-1,4-beta-mannosidase